MTNVLVERAAYQWMVVFVCGETRSSRRGAGFVPVYKISVASVHFVEWLSFSVIMVHDIRRESLVGGRGIIGRWLD